MNSQCRSGFTTHHYYLNRVSAEMAILIVLMGLAGCGGSGDVPSEVGNQGSDGMTSAGGGQGADDTGSAENDSRPSFERFFVDENVQYQNEGYSVQFTVLSPTDPPTSAGRLTGLLEVSSLRLSVAYKVSGTYKGCTVAIALSTDDGSNVLEPISVNYSGRFTSNDSLTLVPKTANLPTLRLLRDPAASRDSGCR